MKILFIYPNDYLNIGIASGIATLSAVLKQAGHEVDLFDFTFVKTRQANDSATVEQGIYLPTPYSLADLVAADPAQSLSAALTEKLGRFKPDLIAVSAMTGYLDEVLLLLQTVSLPCPVIVGGVHATISPQDVLQREPVDLVCVGEGEGPLLELCDCLAGGRDYSKIKNLGFKQGKNIHINESRPFVDLNDLPVPDWSLFDQRHLFRPFMGKIYRGSFYVMSRGCPGQCTYCVNGSIREILKNCGHYFRYQSPATTIKQLAFLKKQYGATWFKFADDSIMLFNEDYLEELARGLKPLGIQFGCSVRPETANKRKVQLLKEMGCVAATVGVESGNERIRKKILNRHMSNQQIEKTIVILQEAGIRVSTFNMIGLPGETRKNVFETIALNRGLGVEAVNAYIVYPYPGTAINKKYNINIRDRQGKIIPVEQASNFALSAMPPREVDGLLKTFDLYIKLPKEKWPLIKRAEGSGRQAEKMLATLREQVLASIKR